MKSKFLKLLAVFLFLVPLGLVFLGAGCEKEDYDYDSDSIIGKWEWIYTLGGVVGVSYPQEGQTLTIEFTEDSMLIERKNGEVYFETNFTVSEDTLKYLGSLQKEEIVKISNDTLSLNDDVFIEYYKQIK